jgi:hypothetical protein
MNTGHRFLHELLFQHILQRTSAQIPISLFALAGFYKRAANSLRLVRYGTYDHLILLLGRLSDFVSKDLSRKQKAIEAQGGGAGTGSPTMFPGMFPAFGKVQAPMGFSPPRDDTPQSDSQEDLDPEASYEAALQEWNNIYRSFEIFKSRLGSGFQPINDEFGDQTRAKSPFGDAIYFKTYSIAGIWMNYYMGSQPSIHASSGHEGSRAHGEENSGICPQDWTNCFWACCRLFWICRDKHVSWSCSN